jgi:(p)ppGpp synthase/HD superfamily hydrolase
MNSLKDKLINTSKDFFNSEQLSFSSELYDVIDMLKLDDKSKIIGFFINLGTDVKINKKIEEEYGKEIVPDLELLRRLSKLSVNTGSKNILSLRKSFVELADDIKIIIIKLAERLVSLRYADREKKLDIIQLSEECLYFYSPVAQMLGIRKIYNELEDISFKNLFPKEFEFLQKKLIEKQSNYVSKLTTLKNDIVKFLAEYHIPAQIQYRIKRPYSIYRKLKNKKLQFDEIFDLLALRIITNSVENCYLALGIVHSKWLPIEGRFRDWVSNPKPNGYRSIQTTVHTRKGDKFEIQIRTEEMHEEAEFGSSAHWAYKQGAGRSQKGEDTRQKTQDARQKSEVRSQESEDTRQKTEDARQKGEDTRHKTQDTRQNSEVRSQKSEVGSQESGEAKQKTQEEILNSESTELKPPSIVRNDWIRNLKEFLDNDEYFENPSQFFEQLRADIVREHINVLTPKGEIVSLPVGSTPIDLAFTVHTDLGYHITGAKVNSKFVKLKTELKSGDVIDIISNPNASPSMDWLNIVKTSRAKSKISRWFKKNERDIYIIQGKNSWEKLKQQHKKKISKFEDEQKLRNNIAKLGYKNFEDFYYAISNGAVKCSLYLLKKLYPDAFTAAKIEKSFKIESKKEYFPAIRVEGMENIVTNLARCCNPIKGVPIVAYITKKSGLKIHASDCPYLSSDFIEKSNIKKAEWLIKETIQLVRCRIFGLDFSKIFSLIVAAAEDESLKIITTQKISTKGIEGIYLEIEVKDITQFEHFSNRIKSSGIVNSFRVV